MNNENGELMEWYWQRKTEVLAENFVPTTHHPAQIPYYILCQRRNRKSNGLIRYISFNTSQQTQTGLVILDVSYNTRHQEYENIWL
jgi:hypothetical protein